MVIIKTEIAVTLSKIAFTFSFIAITETEMAIICFKKGVVETFSMSASADFQSFIILPQKEEQWQEQKQHQSVLCF
jgi:hypothetical protein